MALSSQDLVDVEVTAAQFAQIKNLMDNNVVTQGDWDAKLNVIRRL